VWTCNRPIDAAFWSSALPSTLPLCSNANLSCVKRPSQPRMSVRLQRQTDISKLTVDLIKEELRLRARGEDIPRLPTSRGEALEMIATARRTVHRAGHSRAARRRSAFAPRSGCRGHRRGPTPG
jgi:hypothetical protein